MRFATWMVVVVVGVTGCAVGGDEDYGSDQSEESALSSGLVYFYVSPTAPGSQGFGTLALRRANAKPSTLKPTYGAATLPELRLAGDALTTQAALDAVTAIPYAGHENAVIALVGGRDKGSPWQTPLVEVVELYTPNQAVAIGDVAQKDALFDLTTGSGKVTAHLVNENAYDAASASAVSYDYSASTNPSAAAVAVQGGAFFTGRIDVACHKVMLFWTKCDPPSGVHVTAYFSAN